MARKRTLHRVPQYIALVFFLLLFLYPIVWLVINSFKTKAELFASPWTLPSSLEWDNYRRAVVDGNIGRYFVNSSIVAFAVVTCATLLSAMAAYGLTRLKWKLSKLVLSIFLLGMMIPAHATIVPLFSIFSVIGINNTYLAVIVPHVVFAMPIAICVLSGFLSTIPRELEEAAVIDGCTIPKAFFGVICPISAPSLVTVAVITFITAWNDLVFPQIFLSDPNITTLPVGLTAFKGRYSTDYTGMIIFYILRI
ncbi:MAG: carbohydrate ABC transporter permease [Clostridiales bacterium]|nr:carbohydrate ABC transporter permease [Clostridiales bacterium]